MASLYEISQALHNVKDILDNAENLDEETIQNLTEALGSVEMNFHEKAENIVKMVKSYEAEAEVIDVEIKRLMARKKTAQNKAETLRAGLKGSMEVHGIDNINSVLFKIALSKPRVGGLNITIPAEELPQEYQVVTITPNKKLMMEDIKNGVVIDGVELETVRVFTVR